MKSVAIFRHVASEGPGYLADFLYRQQIPFEIIAVDEGMAVPTWPDDYAGLVFMGGPMSVNDALAWIEAELSLIRQAFVQNIPMLGHCLGGQLISKALSGTVMANPQKEIGWWPCQRVHNAGFAWHNIPAEFPCFHWHGETFSLPAGATLFLSSAACQHQGYVLGPHLALQCHVEVTSEIIDLWCAAFQPDRECADDKSYVMSREQMLSDVDTKVAALHQVADVLYGGWIKNLRF